MSAREVPIKGTELAIVEGLDEGYVEPWAYRHTEDVDAATVVMSRVPRSPNASPFEPTRHKVVIDLDLPAKLVPSTTEGHFHLFIDKEIEDGAYWALLRALVAAGLVEPGYLGASESRGFTAVRLPWIKKKGISE